MRSRAANYLGGYTQIDTTLDFDGSPTKTVTTHKRVTGSTPDITVEENFTYTAQDRLAGHTHKINSLGAQTLTNNTYNKLGQLIIKKVGNGFLGNGYQTVNYKYNIRGWLTDINDVNTLGTDLFAFHISYDKITNEANGQLPAAPPLYNGNISETYWRTSSDGNLRKYSYFYDDLNRLNDAYYQKPLDNKKYTGSYDEHAVYDKNGNITQLVRNGAIDDPNVQIPVDDLYYSYATGSNQLTKVYDDSTSPQGFKDVNTSANDYTYDANGNMITDLNKGITTTNPIKYNHLNLPVEINFGGGNKIVYLYDAVGQKLKKTVTEVVSGTTTTVNVDYVDGFQYKGGVLQFFPTAEGYVDNTVNSSGNNVYNYVYQYKDHLGNVRLSYTAVPGRNGGAPSVVIKEENHYYPFGLKHLNYNVDYEEYQNIDDDIFLYPPLNNNKLLNNYKYNGKELQDELGLNLYDYGARNYDPALGRWMNIDPLAETSRRWSPYTYAYDNPMYFVDPDGMQGEDWFKNNITNEATYIEGATQSTQVSGYTYMCQECAKNELPIWERPASNFLEGDVLYQGNGNKVVMNEGITIGEPLDSGKGDTGIALGISVGGAVGGGTTLEVGLVKDFATDNWGAYFSFKENVGLGGGIGVSGSVITPTGNNDFLINDFNGTGYEVSGSISTPLGGGGYSYGGSATDAINGVKVNNPANPNTWGKGERGYTTGSISPDLNMPSTGVSAGALLTKSKTWVWDL